MSKTMKIILIDAAVLLVVGCGIMLFRFLRAKNQIMDGPGMIREDTFDFSQKHLSRVYYYRGGGELGDSYSVELTMEEAEDGTPDVKVEYYNQPTHSDKARTKTVRLGSFVITGVQGMRQPQDLPMVTAMGQFITWTAAMSGRTVLMKRCRKS